MYFLSPVHNCAHVDQNGHPVSGGTIETYEAGTSTPLLCAKDRNGSQFHNAAIPLDANGMPEAPLWLQGGKFYLFITKDAFGEQVGPTEDFVAGVNDVSAQVVQQGGDTIINQSANEWVQTVTGTYDTASTFKLNGDQTTLFHTGRRVRLVVGGNDLYATVLSSAYSSPNTTVTLANIVNASGGSTSLTNDITATYYGLISAGAQTSAPNTTVTVKADIYFKVVSATQFQILPCGGVNWTMRDASGVIRNWSPGSGLTFTVTDFTNAGTAKYVFLYNTSGSSVGHELAPVTTAISIDPETGLPVKASDNKRLLVGMVMINAAGNGLETAEVLNLSYFNRTQKMSYSVFNQGASGFTTGVSPGVYQANASSSTPGGLANILQASAQPKFLCWGDAISSAPIRGQLTRVQARMHGYAAGGSFTGANFAGFRWDFNGLSDGTTPIQGISPMHYQYVVAHPATLDSSADIAYAKGAHTMTLALGFINSLPTVVNFTVVLATLQITTWG